MGRKFRVLTADDEFWSRKNIQNLIDWDMYGIEFLEPAADGEEVLARLGEEKPDILMTDINMPFVDGLTLLHRIQSEYPDIVTIAISGYDDFEKVKGTFVSGGIDYLLKPVGKEELVGVLTKALTILESRESDREKQADSLERESKLASFMEDNEYSFLLQGKLYHHKDLPFVSSTGKLSEFSTLLLKIHDLSPLTGKYGYDMLQMSYSVKEKLKKIVDAKTALVFNYSDKVNEYLICFNGAKDDLAAYAERIVHAFDEDLGAVTIVIHPQSSSLDDIGTVYREMIAALVTRPFAPEHCIVACTAKNEGSAGRDRLNRCLADELRAAFEEKSASKVYKILYDKSGLKARNGQNWSLFEMTQFVSRVKGIIDLFLPNDELAGSIREEAQEGMDYGLRVLDTSLICRNMEVLIGTVCGENVGQYNDGTVAGQVNKIHDYIKNNYFKPLTLSLLAEQYHVEATYLSRVFSQMYHQSITACITETRIERAKERMRDESCKLEAVSFEIGYDDYNYFSRVFRKQTGCSPTEYRKKILVKNEILS